MSFTIREKIMLFYLTPPGKWATLCCKEKINVADVFTWKQNSAKKDIAIAINMIVINVTYMKTEQRKEGHCKRNQHDCD